MSDDQLDEVVSLPRLPPRSKARPGLRNSPSGSSTPVFHSAHSSRDDVVQIHIDDHESIVHDDKLIEKHGDSNCPIPSAKLSPPLSSPSSASSASSSPALSPPAVPSPVDWKFPTSDTSRTSLPDSSSKRFSVLSTFVPLSPDIDPSGPVPKRPASSGVYTPASFPGPSGSTRRLSSPPIEKVDPQQIARPPLSTSSSSSFFARSKSYLAYMNPTSYLSPSVGSASASQGLASDSTSAFSGSLSKGTVSSSGVYTPASYHEQQIRIASRNVTDPAIGVASGTPAAFPLLSPRVVSVSRGSLPASTSDSTNLGLVNANGQASAESRARADSTGSSLSAPESPLQIRKKTSNIARKPLPAPLHDDDPDRSITASESDSSIVHNETSSTPMTSSASSDSVISDPINRSHASEVQPVPKPAITPEMLTVNLTPQPNSLGGPSMAMLATKEMKPMEVDRPTEEMVAGRVW